ncbi:MAG: thioredoxin domain-containing protein [Terriglobia bacterium]
MRVKSIFIFFVLIACALSGCFAVAGQAPGSTVSEQATRAKIAQYLRERFSVTSAATITVGLLRPSIYPGYDLVTVTIVEGKNKQSQDFYASTDGAYLIQGNVYGLNGNPRSQVEKLIQTEGEPSVGPADAPVTIVEFADLECPMCAEMQQFIEKQLLPKYGNKIRMVFKEYPLFNIHPWAVAAAVANECAYEIDPSRFLAYRSLIFQNQNSIKQATAAQQLEDLGVQAGLDRQKLTACIDAKTSLPHVKKDFLEGEKLGVGSTPTFFINGKMIAGAPSPEAFFKAVDEALAAAAKK